MTELEREQVIREHQENAVLREVIALHLRLDGLEASIRDAANTASAAAEATKVLQAETREVLEAWKTATAGLKIFVVLRRLGEFVFYCGGAIGLLYAAYRFFIEK